jgi:predicted transcriptional regulator
MIGTLPRREREIFEIVASAGKATAVEVRAAMSDPPSHSAVRTLLARLERRGLIRHRLVEQSYVYESVTQPAKVRESALRQLVKTFFNGSAASAATALLGLSRDLEPAELEALQRAIDEARERGS